MKTSRKILYSSAVILVLIAASLILLKSLNPDKKKTLPDTPGFYRPGTISGLSHEHVPGMTGILNGVPVRINSYGFRGAEFEILKKADAKRIIVFGDSVVFGQGVKEESTICVILKNKLGSKYSDKKWEVLNAGVRGYNIIDYKTVFEKRILSLDPDMVIFVITEINDPERQEFIARSKKLEEWKNSWWTNNSVVRPLMAAAWAKEINRLFMLHVRDICDPDKEQWPLFKTDLKEMASLCCEKNVSMIFVSFPFIDDEDVFKNERTRLHEFFTQMNIFWVDPFPAYKKINPKDLVVSENDFHPNKKANQILAEMLSLKVRDVMSKEKQ